MKVLIAVCGFLAMGASAVAHISDLRHSRHPLPGVSEISEVGIVVDMGPAQDLMPPAGIIETLQPRLEMLGYRVALDPAQLPDGLWLQVDCHGLSEKLSARFSRGLQRPLTRAQNFGPPCRLAYSYKQEVIPWKYVDRLIFAESVATMRQLAQSETPLQPQECVKQFFRLYDFPVLLAAEWGHVDRLLQILRHPDTPIPRQRLILTLLGETQVPKGYPVLVKKLGDIQLANEAAEALGFFGLRAQKLLLPILQDRSNPSLQIAAAKGLGRIAAVTGNSQQTPLYMKLVADTSLDIRIRTQLAWALGKAPDMRAFPTLLQLEKVIWTDHSPDPDLQEFREAVDWSIREVKQGGHGDNF